MTGTQEGTQRGRDSQADRVPGQISAASPHEVVTDEITRRIEAYTPADVPKDLWEGTLRPFVVPALLAARPGGRSSMEQYARVLTLISRWCHEQGIALDPDVVLDPDTVERCFSEGMRDIPSRGTYRTVLRRLGPKLATKAPWQPRPEPMARRKVALPYTAREIILIEEDAHRQSTTTKRRAALALLALGAGAGLDGRWATRVRGNDIGVSDGCIAVTVGDPRARAVPVLDSYEDLLAELARDVGDGYIVGGTSTHRNRTNKLVSAFEHGHGHPSLSVPRLRSTWIVEHLRRGTRLPELLYAAGTSRIETFDELLAFVEPMALEAAASMLRGSG
jgi:hypothetical protein